MFKQSKILAIIYSLLSLGGYATCGILLSNKQTIDTTIITVLILLGIFQIAIHMQLYSMIIHNHKQIKQYQELIKTYASTLQIPQTTPQTDTTPPNNTTQQDNQA